MKKAIFVLVIVTALIAVLVTYQKYAKFTVMSPHPTGTQILPDWERKIREAKWEEINKENFKLIERVKTDFDGVQYSAFLRRFNDLTLKGNVPKGKIAVIAPGKFLVDVEGVSKGGFWNGYSFRRIIYLSDPTDMDIVKSGFTISYWKYLSSEFFR